MFMTKEKSGTVGTVPAENIMKHTYMYVMLYCHMCVVVYCFVCYCIYF